MPFALITIGLLVIVSAIRNTTGELATAIKNDFSGPNNFFYWVAGIGVVGSIGYIPNMRAFSRIFLALIIIVMALRNGGFFDKFMQALQSIQAPTASATDAKTGVTSPDGTTEGAQKAAPGTSSNLGTSVDNALGLPSGSSDKLDSMFGFDPHQFDGLQNFAPMMKTLGGFFQ